MKAFKSILEFQKHFNTEDKCRTYLEVQRWGGEICCIYCGSVRVGRVARGNRLQCKEKECRKQFSVTVGTMAENSKIPLTKWFLAMYILSNHSKGMSSTQLALMLGMTQKSSWFLAQRIREMMKDKNPDLLTGVVEADETAVGGKFENKHEAWKRGKKGNENKTVVFGAVQREGKLITKVINQNSMGNVQKAVSETVQPDSVLLTDESHAYKRAQQNYQHHTVNHRAKEYVRGFVHTNTVEGFWGLLKRQIVGIHHFVSPKHLHRYCNEAAHRYNNRKTAQDERFVNAIKGIEGRLKYSELIKK